MIPLEIEQIKILPVDDNEARLREITLARLILTAAQKKARKKYVIPCPEVEIGPKVTINNCLERSQEKK